MNIKLLFVFEKSEYWTYFMVWNLKQYFGMGQNFSKCKFLFDVICNNWATCSIVSVTIIKYVLLLYKCIVLRWGFFPDEPSEIFIYIYFIIQSIKMCTGIIIHIFKIWIFYSVNYFKELFFKYHWKLMYKLSLLIC